MTSPRPCKSKTGDYTSSRARGPLRVKGASELAQLHDAARRIEPMVSSLKREGRGASQGGGSEGCHCIRAARDKLPGCPGQPANVPGLASKEKLWEACKRQVDVTCWLSTRTTWLSFFCQACPQITFLFSFFVQSFILPCFLLSQ